MNNGTVMGKHASQRKPPSSERSYGIQVVHRDRPNLTALTELFVRFILAEANAKRDMERPPVVVRPEVLMPGPDWDSTAKEGTITTRPEQDSGGEKN